MPQVELRPHTGRNRSGREIDLKQDRIVVDGQAVGFVARKPGAPINLIYRDMPVEHVDAIKAAVQAKHGRPALKVSQPPEMPEDVVEDEADEYDED